MTDSIITYIFSNCKHFLAYFQNIVKIFFQIVFRQAWCAEKFIVKQSAQGRIPPFGKAERANLAAAFVWGGRWLAKRDCGQFLRRKKEFGGRRLYFWRRSGGQWRFFEIRGFHKSRFGKWEKATACFWIDDKKKAGLRKRRGKEDGKGRKKAG